MNFNGFKAYTALQPGQLQTQKASPNLKTRFHSIMDQQPTSKIWKIQFQG